jgi:hypothetical protein
MASRVRSYPARMLDIDAANGLWYCAVRDGLVEMYAEDASTWALTDRGLEVAYRRAFTQGADPECLSASQLISLAVYGITDMG